MTRRRGLREGRSQSKIETDEGVQAVSFKRSEEKINVKWEDVEKGITGSEKNSREKKKSSGWTRSEARFLGWFFLGFLPPTEPLWELQHEIIITVPLIQGLPYVGSFAQEFR